MIKVNKTIPELPPSLTVMGKRELEAANKQFREKGQVTLDFKAYRQQDVKDKLFEIFNEKCAYCESVFNFVSPGAVEHFRPKKRSKKIKGYAAKYQGYFWLAMKWENLLLSCTDCNTVRGHSVDGSKKKISMGKQDYFPLADEKKRCCKPSDKLDREKSVVYLVNPCDETDDPERYFEFDNEGVIKVHPDLKTEFERTKSQTSIDVFALRRQELVDERKRYFKREIGDRILDIEGQKQTLAALKDDAVVAIANINKEINRKLRELIELARPQNRYSAMCKQVVAKEVKDRLGIDISTIQ